MTFAFANSAQRMIKYDRAYLIDGLNHLDTRDTVYNSCIILGPLLFLLACVFTLLKLLYNHLTIRVVKEENRTNS